MYFFIKLILTSIMSSLPSKKLPSWETEICNFLAFLGHSSQDEQIGFHFYYKTF